MNPIPPTQEEINQALMTPTEQPAELRRICNAMQDVINDIKVHLSATKDGLEKIYQGGYVALGVATGSEVTSKTLAEEYDKLYQELIEISAMSGNIKHHVYKIV